MLIYHLGIEHWTHWWPHFRDVVSTHRHEIMIKVVSRNIIIIFHHEFRPGWPVSVSAFTSSSSLSVVVQVVIFLLDDNLEVFLLRV
jgi:hypothetical protein